MTTKNDDMRHGRSRTSVTFGGSFVDTLDVRSSEDFSPILRQLGVTSSDFSDSSTTTQIGFLGNCLPLDNSSTHDGAPSYPTVDGENYLKDHPIRFR
jgi:hypothetical protein